MLFFSLICVIALTLPTCIESIYGTDCLTPKSESGSCMPIFSCASVLSIASELSEGRGFEHAEFLSKSFCGSVGTLAYVCCPKDEIKINSDRVTEHLAQLNCGINDGQKIAGGECAKLLQYRWMVLLVYKGKNPFLCDGTLIDDQHVLTAAHCLYNNTNLPVAVRLGEYNLNSVRDCKLIGDEEVCLDPVEEIPIDTIIPHGSYKRLNHDIALIRLKTPIQCKSSMRPICLPITQKLQSNLPDSLFTAGWGYNEFNTRPDCLKYAEVPNQPRRLCMDAFNVKLSDGHICAGGKNNTDICNGDSGGPLFYDTGYVNDVTRAVQYGIISEGLKTQKCGARNLPAVYTNVVPYMQWILDHMDLNENAAASNCYIKKKKKRHF